MPTSFPRDDEPTASHDELASSSYAPRDHQPQTDAELLAAVAASGTVVADVADDDDEPPALLDEPPALLPANFAETLSRRHSRASSLNSSPPPPTSTWMSPERYVLVGGPARGPGVPAQADASGSAQAESASPGATQVDMNGATLNIEPNVDDGTYQAALASMGARALRVESLELVSSALIRRLQALRGLLLCYVCQESLLREDRASSPSSTTTPSDVSDDEEPVRATPCRHLFHEDCLSPWFESNTTCPTCRYDAAPSLPLDFASFMSGAPLFDEIDWDGGEPDEQEEDEFDGDDDFPVSSPDSERPTTPPPTRRDGVYVAGNDQSSPPRTPMRPTSGADRDEHELGGSPDDKSEASPSAQARPAAPLPPPPPPPQSPLSRFGADRTDGSDTEEEDAPTSPPRTPPRRTFPRDSVRTPSLSPEMPFHPRTPPRTAPLERLDTADRALFDLIAQPGTWTESPSARLPRALSLSVSLDDLRATAAASIDLSAPPSAISFQPVGQADPALNAQLVAAGLRLDSSLSDAPRTDSPEPNADAANLTMTVGSRVARELFGLPLPPPGQVTWVDAVKPAMSFAEWVAEHEAAAAARETSEEDERAVL